MLWSMKVLHGVSDIVGVSEYSRSIGVSHGVREYRSKYWNTTKNTEYKRVQMTT